MIHSVISSVLSKAPLLAKSRTWLQRLIRGKKEVMKIVPDVPNVTGHGMYYVGVRPRSASATAVKFISDSMLVASHLVGNRASPKNFARLPGNTKCQVKCMIWYMYSGVTAHEFYHLYDLKGFNFPDGIDIDKGNQLVAVTNYGDHSIYLRRL